MKLSARREWAIPAVFITLTLASVIGGVQRVNELATSVQVTSENARYFAHSIPLTIHIIASCTFCLLGAFQFMPHFRRARPQWHRVSGRLLVLAGLTAGLSGLWLNQFFPPGENDGSALYVVRMLVGTAMTLFIGLGLWAIAKRRFTDHQNWMIRAYALGMGNSLLPFLLVIALIIDFEDKALAKVLVLGSSWLINIVIAEWVIHRLTNNKKSVNTIYNARPRLGEV